ncbi:MAG TPA: class I SAM-dependent methyltransferase [Thiobacillaceae bacterium]|nr:class I SAM-dependent methyltransferase [Thiobacillaceae bacterium]HNU62961.1 class I SAM-dependent methyltransferase [Thiobacillaceae bacterium]
MQAWFESDVGRYVLAREQAWFDAVSADLFGFNALQLCGCGQDFLRANRMPYRFCAGLDQGQLHCLAEQLPLASQSLDLVVLPHVLEFSPDPHELLREVERTLRPEGRVLIAGFNPFSLWGVRRLFSSREAGWPWQARFIHLARLKDWLALLGFDLVGGRMACYAPPIDRRRCLERFAFLEAAGDRWWALGGGVYLLHGVKRVRGMRLIEPRWDKGWTARPSLAHTPRKSAQ